MKTIDELGISPMPWSVRDEVPLEGGDDPCGKWLVDGDGNDLITALELYEALREVVNAFDRGDGLAATIKPARHALAKASGLVTIPEARLVELVREESTLDSYRKAHGEMHDKLIEIRRALYALGRTDRSRLDEIENIINGNEEAK